MRKLNKSRANNSPLVPQVLPLIRFHFIDCYICGVSFKSHRHSFDLVTKYAPMLFFFPQVTSLQALTLSFSPDLPLEYVDWNELHPQTLSRGSFGYEEIPGWHKTGRNRHYLSHLSCMWVPGEREWRGMCDAWWLCLSCISSAGTKDKCINHMLHLATYGQNSE